MAAPIRFIGQRETLAELMHTALRKLCDSTASSLMWNLFHIISDRAVISDYYDVIWRRIQHGRFRTDFELAEAVRQAVLEDFDSIGQPSRAALRCAAEMLSLDDWMGYIGYLVEYTQKKVDQGTRQERWQRQFAYLGDSGRLRLAPNQLEHLFDEAMSSADQAEGVYELAAPEQIQVILTRAGQTQTHTFALDPRTIRVIEQALDALCRRRARERFAEFEKPKWHAAQDSYVEQVMATF